MTDSDIQSYVDDIVNSANDESKDISRDEVEKELKKFLEYGVPIDQAKQTLIKKYGGAFLQQSSERTLVQNLEPNQYSVNLTGLIISVNPKEIQVKGENKKIFYGIFRDESGTVSFTAWNDFKLEKGSAVEISNAYTKEWQGDTKLNFGDRTKISKIDKSKIPKIDLEPKKLKINELKSGLGSVEVTAKILEINEREVKVDEQKKKVFSGIIGDETGKAQFTSWHDFKLKKDSVVKILGAYVKSWKGIPQLTFDEKATVKKVDSSKIPKKEIPIQKISLHELNQRKGALDIETEGTIIDILDGSGIVYRCSECNRVLRDNECSIHGNVKGIEDLRLKLIIDDGLGTTMGIINKEISEKLLGKSIDEIKKNNDSLEEMNKKLFGQKIILRGNALGDSYGTSIIANDGKILDFDFEQEAKNLLEELEDLL